MSYGETILRGSTGIPVLGQILGVGLAGYDVGRATINGDWGGVAEGFGGLVGGYAGAKGMLGFTSPEAGAQFGIKRLGTALPYEITDSAGVSGGLLPPLPAEKTDTFSGLPTPREFAAGELARVYEQGNPQATFNGRYWATEVPSSEANWRGPFSVLKTWGNLGTDIAISERSNTWVGMEKLRPWL